MNRREFSKKSLTFVALGFIFPLLSCGESEALTSLRNILRSIEKAVESLASVQGLLPEVIREIRQYLTTVANFVEKVSDILGNEKMSDADKASNIVNLASTVVVPNITNANAAAIILTVVAAFNAFMALFKSRGNGSFSMNDTEKEALVQIQTEAMEVKTTVRDWANDALGAK